ncbi:MAG: hypothetical protein FWD52_04980 [Candidatus Bathyarchaeota archaeon]|nr:hypothetical protein [Candidatus Termiticorpusculum sp.]
MFTHAHILKPKNYTQPTINHPLKPQHTTSQNPQQPPQPKNRVKQTFKYDSVVYELLTTNLLNEDLNASYAAN